MIMMSRSIEKQDRSQKEKGKTDEENFYTSTSNMRNEIRNVPK